MAPTSAPRMIVTVAAAAALPLTSAGACGPTEPGDDDAPAVTTQLPVPPPTQQPDTGSDDTGPDDTGPDDAGPDDTGPDDGAGPDDAG
jgi:magnesium chelatase subunit D